MMYLLFTFIIYFLFKYFKSRYQLSSLKEKFDYEIFKVEQKIEVDQRNPIHQLRIASIYLQVGNLIMARKYLLEALTLIDENNAIVYSDELIDHIKKTVSFTDKPLPWSRNDPRDHSNSALFFLLVKGFGGRRYYF